MCDYFRTSIKRTVSNAMQIAQRNLPAKVSIAIPIGVYEVLFGKDTGKTTLQPGSFLHQLRRNYDGLGTHSILGDTTLTQYNHKQQRCFIFLHYEVYNHKQVLQWPKRSSGGNSKDVKAEEETKVSLTIYYELTFYPYLYPLAYQLTLLLRFSL